MVMTQTREKYRVDVHITGYPLSILADKKQQNSGTNFSGTTGWGTGYSALQWRQSSLDDGYSGLSHYFFLLVQFGQEWMNHHRHWREEVRGGNRYG